MGTVSLALMYAAVLAAEPPEELSVDFRGGRPLPNVLHLLGPEADQKIQTESEGLRLTLPRDRKHLGPVGVFSAAPVRGDFVITASYEILQAEEPKSGSGVGVTLYVKKANPSPEAASVSWRIRVGGKEVAFWDRAMGDTADKLRFGGGTVPVAARTGQLRLQRTGTTLHFSVAPAGEPFQEIHQCNFGSEELDRVRLTATTGSTPCAVNARWLDLRVQGEALPGTAMLSRGWRVPWLASAGFVCLAMVVGWVILWRRQRGTRPVGGVTTTEETVALAGLSSPSGAPPLSSADSNPSVKSPDPLRRKGGEHVLKSPAKVAHE